MLTFTFPNATWFTSINLFLQLVLPGFEYLAERVAESAKYMPLPNIPGSLLVPPKSSTTIFGSRRPLKKEMLIIIETEEVNKFWQFHFLLTLVNKKEEERNK